MSIYAIKPIPVDLRKELHDYYIPWRISDRIFNEMKQQGVQGSYKKVQVLPTDPEWRFVWRYFHHDKPNKYGIKRIYCIYQRHQQQVFELNLSSMETEANTLRPTWNKEPRASQRANAIERWKETVDVFSPFDATESDGRRKSFKEIKILPLWYGSNKSVLDSIAKSGFVYFGKTSPGGDKPQSTDDGFFGNGIYFTNSARYASDIYSEGHLFLAWVSMREPFPVVGDPDQIDMKGIKGKGAYKDYNAHYISVTSINPSDHLEKNYYPTKEEEIPHCDEIVVFQKSQTLPRFWVELSVELPYVPSDTPQFVNELIPHIMKLLQDPNIDRDNKLRNYLCKELEFLLILEGDDYLEERHKNMYEQLKQILDPQGKVNRQVSRALTGTPQPSLNSSIPQSPVSEISTPQPTMSHQPVTSELKSNSIISKPVISNTKDSYSSIPSIAFGKADWEKYFGEIGLEPPLPANIEKILNERCSFWPNKKVKETHLLVLIPNTVNGKPFTMNYLGKLIQNPKSGHATKYEYYCDYVRKALGDKSYPSHWVLMTRDIIPGSRSKGSSKCRHMIANHSNKTGLPYELPNLLEATASILMHYVKKGERLYGYNPWTYTFCQDVDKYNGLLVVGGFTPVGLFIPSCFIEKGVAGCWKF